MDADYSTKVKNYHKTAQSIHTFVLVALSIMLIFSFLPFFIKYPDLMGDGGEGESMLSVFDNPLMSEYKLHVVLLFVLLAVGFIATVYGFLKNSQSRTKIEQVTVTLQSLFYTLRGVIVLSLIVFLIFLFLAFLFTSGYRSFLEFYSNPLPWAVVLLALTLGGLLNKKRKSDSFSKMEQAEKSAEIQKKQRAAYEYKAKKCNTEFNSLLFLFDSLAFSGVFVVSIILLVDINSKGLGLIKPGATLYVVTVLGVLALLGSVASFVYLNTIKRTITVGIDKNEIVEDKGAIVSVDMILFCGILSFLLVFCIITHPVWSIVMHFRADDVKIGMSVQEVRDDLLGKPSYVEEDETKNRETWYYFNKSFERKYLKAEEYIEEAEATGSLGAAFEAYLAIDGEKYTVLRIVFEEVDNSTSSYNDGELWYNEMRVVEVVYERGRVFSALDGELIED